MPFEHAQLEINQLCRSPTGVRQTSEQWAEGPRLHLIVDALSLAGQRHAEQLAQRAEGLLQLAFDGHDPALIDEALCTQVFRQVHRDLMADTELESIGVAVSALVLVYTPHVSGEGRLLVAGVGDCRLYQLEGQAIRCLFADPHGRAALPGASADERLTQLRHALCRQPALQVACHRLQLGAESRLAAVSWSLYAHTSEEELAQRLGKRGKEMELAGWLAQQPQNGHGARLSLFTRTAVAAPHAIDASEGRRRWQRRWALGLAAAACGLVAVVVSEAWPKPAVSQVAMVVESPSLPDTQLEHALVERSELARTVERMQGELEERELAMSRMAQERASWLEQVQEESVALGAKEADANREQLEVQLVEREEQVIALQDQLSTLVSLLDTKEQLLQQVQNQAHVASQFEEGYQREQKLREQLTDQLATLKEELTRQRKLLQQLDVAEQSAAHRTHRVSPGETLTAIAQKYYGTSKRWREIYEANRAELPSQNTLRPGVTLVIP